VDFGYELDVAVMELCVRDIIGRIVIISAYVDHSNVCRWVSAEVPIGYVFGLYTWSALLSKLGCLANPPEP
jgi:hypothetical protein